MLHTALRHTKFHVKEEGVLVDQYLGMPIWKISSETKRSLCLIVFCYFFFFEAIFSSVVAVVVGIIEYLSPWSGTLSRHLYGGWTAPTLFFDPFAPSWYYHLFSVCVSLFAHRSLGLPSLLVASWGCFRFLRTSFWIRTLPFRPHLSQFPVCCFDLPSPMSSTACHISRPFTALLITVSLVPALESSLAAICHSVSLASSSSTIQLSQHFASFWAGSWCVSPDSLSIFSLAFLQKVLFGARLAGGCASGHGLSGIARLSSASLITAACMFVGAIGSGLIAAYLW
jgi:hypothetical protein